MVVNEKHGLHAMRVLLERNPSLANPFLIVVPVRGPQFEGDGTGT
jgi:hypothetical protein